MNIYDFLIVKKRGGKYKTWTSGSLYNVGIDPDKQVKGESRIWGDASAEVQKIVIDKIISLGSRLHLSYKDIAYALLLCYAESGFNPDAAAGTTSASGLAQYTRGTMKDFSRRAKKYLSQTLNMDETNVFDVDIGVYGVLAAYLFNKDLSEQWITSSDPDKFWQTIYMLHHDGPGYYKDDRGKERAIRGKWSQDAVQAYNTKILPKLDKLESLLANTEVDLEIQLEDSNGQPVVNKEYIIATHNSKVGLTPKKPAMLSTDRNQKKSYHVVHGKTDANGLTKKLAASVGCEVIILLCANRPKKLGNAIPEKDYTVKKGDTLSKIAKQNGTTINQIAKDNHISNPNKINIGQKLVIKKKYLRHKPSGSAIKDILEQAGLSAYGFDSIIYSQNHITKPDGSTSASARHSKKNTVTLRTSTPATFVNKKNKEVKKKEINDTTKEGSSKIVHSQYPGKAVIYTYQDTNYPPRGVAPSKGYTAFYDHLGNKLFSFTSGGRVDSHSEDNADGPMKEKFTYIEGGYRTSRLGREFGTTKIRSTDRRRRWIHGGGPKKDFYVERQSWRVTYGCTRAQNIDLETLAQKIREFRHQWPHIEILMIRNSNEADRKRYPR
ncbi:LysM peptidoglycan-binding domain-containing protein [Neisseria sp. DTU_2021_1001991_1_SI_NGA_ILE_055]|uniref:LysM peptidoglycan-binding domain-containing protein n=1 Tax=Neisseria sp. DTU_2021_1001991_1_SI_NGA_ILE_055 TaxID=3077590 RepID=UPI0028EBEDF6|nr:LysM peptidoglycan-binding domain-containing protein [Neisseria sp. DTU_2021_1001991_1_SI_NGA_ILE_055]WNS84109.1 LysM peptidoglycan-binding domain-containing protein [Neisseria sp. DTU_2021_1001991_1_SI_NGA_ILE_055]